MRFLELCQIADWEYTCVVPNSAGNAFNVLFLSQLFTIDFWQIFCIMLRKLFFFFSPLLAKNHMVFSVSQGHGEHAKPTLCPFSLPILCCVGLCQDVFPTYFMTPI